MFTNAIKIGISIALIIVAIVGNVFWFSEWLEKHPNIKKIVGSRTTYAVLLVVAIVLLAGVFQNINAVREALNVPPPTPKAPLVPQIIVQPPSAKESVPPTSIAGIRNLGNGNKIEGNTVNVLHTGSAAIAPNGIAIGGGNVTNPTVNNFGPKPLVLIANQQEYITSKLVGFAGQKIELDVDGPTPMTNDFAGALQSSLIKAGVDVTRNNAIFAGPCLKYPGVSFMVGANRAMMAEAIWNALLGAKVVEGKGQGCSRSGAPDELVVFVRPPG